ncbi:DUF4260 domain-containing protein [Woodsholea maritima]|uniref:DUF4260 domain-containing protein n=1 Tax=Woodsholea maritima TaxID=240237 RepID=UPI000381F2BB|nr:DUF4260 domain-containing protein [Woodsholea maritima]
MSDIVCDPKAVPVRGGMKLTLRLEGLGVLALSIAMFAQFDWPWWIYIAAFVLPDLSFLGYFAGARIGAIAYNAAHSYIGPILLAAMGMGLYPQVLPAVLIWAGHIGFDRMLGYGLKSIAGFRYTHLGLIGRNKAPADPA